jgi:hypothetical protein
LKAIALIPSSAILTNCSGASRKLFIMLNSLAATRK